MSKKMPGQKHASNSRITIHDSTLLDASDTSASGNKSMGDLKHGNQWPFTSHSTSATKCFIWYARLSRSTPLAKEGKRFAKRIKRRKYSARNRNR